jgi:hypothetical protein
LLRGQAKNFTIQREITVENGDEVTGFMVETSKYLVTRNQLLLEQSHDIYLPVKYGDFHLAGIVVIHLNTITMQERISAE